MDDLPIPGVVLGGYPERSRQARQGHRSRRAWRLPFPWRRRGSGREQDPFLWEVGARREILEQLSDQSLSCVIDLLRRLLFSEGFSSGLLGEVMACVCECARRTLGVVPYDTQISAARLMLDNQLAEMATGEGKTLATGLTAAVAALAGIPVHCVTANDYLVRRDAAKIKPLYDRLGLGVGTVIQSDDQEARARAYACDITYCTAKELVFDYLKDRMQLGQARHDLLYRVHAISQEDGLARKPLLRGLCMAIVDEADSVLIDEAGTPLILARARPPGGEALEFQQAMRIARNLRAPRHFQCTGERIELTTQAKAMLEHMSTNSNGVVWDARRREELVMQALSALHVYERDRHYVLINGKVSIIDQTTGRIADGRTWSRGLHQLIEIKEGCELTGTQETIAQITYQRFFPRYIRLAGTSGTLREARSELRADYKLGVQPVALRCPSQLTHLGLRMFSRAAQKWRHVVERAREVHAQGRAQLIGTDSVAGSEQLSAMLRDAGLTHQVLNARQDQAEADIIAAAGRVGSITVATNMAGRGTDILLESEVARVGGLHVISCQLNPEARIDRQLHGRAGRQGDPGSVETVLSLEEPLLQRRLAPSILRGVARTGMSDKPLPERLARIVVRTAQRLEEIARRLQRRNLIRRDASNERRLSLSGTRE